MKKNNNFYLERNSETREMVYIEYTDDNYEVTPKRQKKDTIEVNKIVFVSPTMSEKIIKRKIDNKIKYFLKVIKVIEEDEDGTSSGIIRDALVEAERYKLKIISEYVKYLGNTYSGLTLEKMQLIIKKLRTSLYSKQQQELLNLMQEEPKKGRGR